MSNKTIDYYNQNADSFVQGTVSVDFKKTQDKFLRLLTGKTILDFGCGSGRDTKYFLESGFDVTATDGSEELCKVPVHIPEFKLNICYFRIWMKQIVMMGFGRVLLFFTCLKMR